MVYTFTYLKKHIETRYINVGAVVMHTLELATRIASPVVLRMPGPKSISLLNPHLETIKETKKKRIKFQKYIIPSSLKRPDTFTYTLINLFL